ncbi:DUF6220 domain-containing protein [Neobacillus mesonae]|uniref:DUF6220 domain-containing protein n=1 Tax=Neobacillus mesonae TaxID=1193713 RepID=UPI00203B94D3|nr:DUF6220 domain-containing protein [Neobacillus mesonae]MCM3569918.1 DUF6220 domain-containing protein [Neobacillus mesonae]
MKQELRTNRSQIIGFLFVTLAILFFSSIIIQIFLAGIGLFVQGNWGYHTNFIHFFELIPLVLFVLSFFGGNLKTLRWQCLALYFMTVLQYITIVFSASSPYLSAFHLVIASLLFWRSLVTARSSVQLVKIKK